VYICPDHNEKYHQRKVHMDGVLAALGCTNVHMHKSGTEAYPKCLSQAVIDILSDNLDNPVFILEDDVIFTPAASMGTFDYVDDADAIYLGLGKCAGHPTEDKDEGQLQVEPYSMTQVRVKNMLSGHAILYISRQYKLAVIELLKANLDKVLETDVLVSRIQPKFKVLALMRPMFYQSATLNPGTYAERLTNFYIGYITGFGQSPPTDESIYTEK
jgi:hypothetical protein